ncbi:hypothetical protein ACTXT7_005144, partial [Hymenolepis weldensis]
MPVFPEPKVLSTVQEANENMNLHPPVRNSVKVTNFTQSMESLMPKVAPAQLVFEPAVPKKQYQSANDAALLYYRDCICSQSNDLWPYISLSLVGPIRGISYLILVHLYSKLPEVMSIKSVTAGTVINSTRQIFAYQGVPKHSPPNLSDLDEQLVDKVKRQLFTLHMEETAEEFSNLLRFRYRTTDSSEHLEKDSRRIQRLNVWINKP